MAGPASILSHPFRLTPGGQVATVIQDTPEANIEQIAVLGLTQAGERPMVPGFGVRDPAFRGLEVSELAAGIAAFGPPVTLKRVVTSYPDEATQTVLVEFE